MNISPELLRRKKMVILGCGILMYFLTSMSKVLIPATIFNELQALGLNARHISATGAAFMYAYAASQLLAGIYADRYGGVRILLIGGSLFTLGTISFPLTGYFPLMLCCRVLTGFGAGTVFLGVAKLLNDLFSAKFSLALGIILVLGYFGPTTGTVPMKLLIGLINWKNAMMFPGLLSLAALLIIVLLMRGTIKPVRAGQTLAPLFTMIRNFNMWMLCLGVSVIFGIYYGISSQFGAKSLEDFCKVSPERAAFIIMILTVIVAVNNLVVNFLLKLCGNRRKVVALLGAWLCAAGCLLAVYAFRSTPGLPLVVTAYVLIAFPAGFFPLFGTIGKELCPPEHTALAVAMVNFWCFVDIAVFQNITGWVLQHNSIPGETVFPPYAYSNMFVCLLILALAGCVLNIFYPETRPENCEK